MPITYVPLFIDMLSDHFEDLTDEEVGQIVRATLLFAAEGVEPEFERRSVLGLTWKRMRAHVIQCMEKSETNKANGSKGGRPPKNPTKPTETEENRKKPKETEKNPTKPNKTENNHEQEQEQEQEQSQEQEQYQEQEQEQEQFNAPATDDDRILAFDGSDLTQASADNEQAQRLVARYMPASKTPIEFDPRVADISDLIAQYGLKKVEDTMKEAMRSDNRGGISVNFIKAIIEGKGSKARAAPGGDYLKRQYDDDYWKSIEQTFDDAI